MKTIKISCPACGQSIEAPAEVTGQSVQCPTCNHEFVVPPRRSEWKIQMVIAVVVLVASICLTSVLMRRHPAKRPPLAQIDPAEQARSEFERLQSQASKGDVKAQVALGTRYLKGDAVATNLVEAVNWFRKAAEQGDLEGQVAVGKCYYYGQGVATNFIEAINWWRRAAEKENAEAMLALSIAYYNGQGVPKDEERSDKLLTNSAELGNSDAQYVLAHMVYDVAGTHPDKAQAAKWYAEALKSSTKAAEGRDAKAQLRVGQCYRYFADNTTPTLRVPTISPDGNATHTPVADILRTNVEGAKLLAEAFQWFKKAGEQGRPDAQLLLAAAYRKGEGVATNIQEAIRWYTEAAEQGDIKAPGELAYIYENGEGVEKNPKKAVEWYIKAGNRGDPLAAIMLSSILNNSVTKDVQPLVFDWFLNSARKGNVSAQTTVADFYMASGVNADKAEAAKWYMEAAKQHDAHAQEQLAYMYKDGKGVGYSRYLVAGMGQAAKELLE